jgi:PAS domain S-box-containing protein
MFDTALVTLSIVIAAVASYTALELSGRIRAYRGRTAAAWLAAAAIAMGGGIWSMHFVAMLAYSQPGLVVSYDPGLTVASLLIAIAVTGVAFAVSGRPGAGAFSLGLSGLFMGLGVVTMHFTGMRAMSMHAAMSHDPFWVGVAALIAVAAATGALWLRDAAGGGWRRWVAALAMGVAISGMHYSGMLGVGFAPENLAPLAQGDSDLTRTTLVLVVSGTTFVVLFVALVASIFDRRMADMSQREAAALRQSEERSRDLYRQTPLPLHALDAEGVVEQVSDEWLELLGRDRDEVLGRPLADFMEPVSALEQSATGLSDQRQAERRFVAKDGRILDVLLSTRVERDDSGRFLRALGGLVDVTARKRTEAALRQSQKIEAIGQLTGGVAHDFNNLLAVVLGNLELLGRRMPDDPKLRRLVDGAVQGAQRGAALTQRLLAFSRRQDLRPEPVDVPPSSRASRTWSRGRSGLRSPSSRTSPAPFPRRRSTPTSLSSPSSTSP